MEIDLVIPMVFPEDTQWQEEYSRHKGNGPGAVKHVRYRSWGTEELLVRCCLKYMPWLRRIHLLLASPSQVRGWMTPTPAPPEGEPTPAPPEGRGSTTGRPSVHLVFHREFIPEEFLPCFSSPCIEMFLHRIPGLAERFIYANDDMFPLSPLSPDDFFLEGRPCQRFVEKPFPAKPNIFQRKCMYQLNMIAKPFGKHYRGTWMKNGHSMAPILKSSCEKVWERNGKEIISNLSPLKRTDRSYNHYIYSLYQYFAGIDVTHAPRQQYAGKGTPTSRIAEIIRDPQAGIVCLNDNEGLDDWKKRAAVVRKEIAAKLADT